MKSFSVLLSFGLLWGQYCLASPNRTSVGFYINTNNNIVPIGYSSTNGGASWSLNGQFSLPANAAANGAQNNQLQNVVCNSSGVNCIAVGFYLNNSNNIAPLSYITRNSGATWTLTSPLASPADIAANGIQNNELLSTSCDSSAQRCSTVGFYLTYLGNVIPLSYSTINGGSTWSLGAAFSLPQDIANNSLQKTELHGIDCDNNGSRCIAVGFYKTNQNNYKPLSYVRLNNSTAWSLNASFPLPNDIASSGLQNSSLQHVSCDSSDTRCTAVGYYFTNANNYAPLSYFTVNGGSTWTLSSKLSLPSDSAGNGTQNSRLRNINCDNTGLHCVAVGNYLNANNNILPLSYYSINGGQTWSLGSPSLLPKDVASNGIQNSQLHGVSCETSGNQCTAIGFYLNRQNNLLPLGYITSNRGVTWTLSSAFPLPANVAANGKQKNKLFSISG